MKWEGDEKDHKKKGRKEKEKRKRKEKPAREAYLHTNLPHLVTHSYVLVCSVKHIDITELAVRFQPKFHMLSALCYLVQV